MKKRKNSGNFALLGKYDDDSDRWLSVTTSTFRKRKKSREREKYIGWLADYLMPSGKGSEESGYFNNIYKYTYIFTHQHTLAKQNTTLF